MEIFGIPVFIIILIVFWVCTSCSEQQKKEAEQIAKKWNSVRVGMSKEEVIERLGEPNRVLDMGIQKIWGYGANKPDGLIYFEEDNVVGYQKPSCTANVNVT